MRYISSQQKRIEIAFSVQRLAFRAIRYPLLLSAIFLGFGPEKAFSVQRLAFSTIRYSLFATRYTLSATSFSSLSKGTVLRVNDDGVTSTDVINPIGEQLQTLASRLDRREFLSPVSRARELITQSTAERVRSILLYQYAKKQLEKNENFEMAIETQMAERRKEFLAQYDGSEARARKELAKYGASIEDQFKELERSLIVRVYQETYIMPSLEVTR